MLLLERLTLVSLFVAVALAACSDATAPAVPSLGNEAGAPDTGDAGRALRSPDDGVVRGTPPIFPGGVRLTVLRGDPKPPKSPRR